MKYHLCFLTLALAAAPFVVQAANPSNPNHEFVEVGLATHGGDVSKELAASCQSLYEKSLQSTNEILSRREKNQKLDPKMLADVHTWSIQLRRFASRLQNRAEPAGVDYEFRGVGLLTMVDGIISSLKLDPNSANGINEIRQIVKKGEKRRTQSLAKIRKLIEQQKWMEADKELYESQDLWDGYTVFLTDGERQAVHEPFLQLKAPIDVAVVQLQKEQVRAELQKRLADSKSDLDGLLVLANNVAKSVRTQGTADVGNGPSPGPACVQELGNRWQISHASVLRSRAILWAMQSQFGGQGTPTDGDNHLAIEAALVSGYTKFSTAFVDALLSILEADTAHVSAADVPQLHLGYLQAFAPLISRVGPIAEKSLFQRVDPAMEKLAQKQPEFGQRVARYREATDELLRWRSRIADAATALKAVTFVPIETRYREGTASADGYVGLFPPLGATGQMSALLGPVPKVMPTAARRMLGQPTMMLKSVAMSNGKSLVFRLQKRTFGNMSRAALPVDEAVAGLRNDLMISDSTPPLTLQSAVAFDSALRGDFAAVGGTISGFHLEGLVTRLSTLPELAAPLTPLGTLTDDTSLGGYLPQVMMRFEISPQWVQHSHFFVELPGSNAGSE